ncbi:hypothetical protein [Streptomyces sp. NPDC059247]|uniref:hypothetical protein n=1 Tax=Streptomyces sp. NPDC059247 TaxID=3346790 RepID=UPI00367CC0AB
MRGHHLRAVAGSGGGHALGLCHKPRSVDTVMRVKISITHLPTAVDKANLKKLWG